MLYKPAKQGTSPTFYNTVQFSRSVISDSFQPHGLQHARPPCPSSTPRVYSNSCPLSQWCHPTFSFLCSPLLLPPSIFPSIRVFSNESVLHIRWPKFWSFNISSSNEYSVLISFRTDWFEFPTAQRTLKSLLQCLPLKSINNLDPDNYLVLSTLYSLTLTFIYDYQKIYSTD